MLTRIKSRTAFAFILVVYTFIQPSTIFSQDDSKEMRMAKDEWQQIYDAYALRAILLISKRDSLNLVTDSLRTVDSLMTISSRQCMNELYALLGTDEPGIAEYRKKFDETERTINNRTGTPADARRNYFDEISSGRISCLSEFSSRFASMKKKMDVWEGKTGEITEKENPIEPPKEQTFYPSNHTYKVEKGDNLKIISLREYGSEDYWELIWKANKDGVVNKYYFYNDENRYINDPDKIYPGQILRIPPKPETP
ncbi:MAG: LysM peptidoglycan-binding domain-containing protein [Ignavibacteria bacterium]